ncbi:phosphodiester glycosidase family protein [Clostridium swellfunianum]|nr:phosphodiester glycosidase family protein [Clostridium swellfunianum]
MVYYGPFKNIRDMLVTTAMTTFSHQYIATAFLNEKTINEIMEKNRVHDENKYTDESAIAAFNSTSGKDDGDHKQVTAEVEDKIELKNLSNGKYKAYMIVISNPKRVVVASSDRLGKAGTKLSDIVKDYNAAGGINAGGFADDNGHGSGGTPTGILIEGGKVLYGKENQRLPLIGFNEDSVLVLGNYTPKEAIEKKIRDAVNFGPFLIVNGEPTIKGGNGGGGLQPRTAIGQRKDGTVLMLVIDGRRIDSIGATLKEVQDLMLEHGAFNAANLDGGSSSTMFYGGQLVNKPSTPAGERLLPSAFIVK